MEKDFHLAVTYVVARLAGFGADESTVIATCAQYVDDTVNAGTVDFKTGQKFLRISSSHEKIDPRNFFASVERRVWVPFHFLPAAEFRPASSEREKFFSSLICRPNSQVAQAMLSRCVASPPKPYALHKLGITAHVFVDTWAHQGFAGLKHKINRAFSIKLLNPPKQNTWGSFAHLKRVVRTQGIFSLVSRLWYLAVCQALNLALPMGHGTVLHFPDWPFLKWSYVNGHGEKVERDNAKDFLTAADEL